MDLTAKSKLPARQHSAMMSGKPLVAPLTKTIPQAWTKASLAAAIPPAKSREFGLALQTASAQRGGGGGLVWWCGGGGGEGGAGAPGLPRTPMEWWLIPVEYSARWDCS